MQFTCLKLSGFKSFVDPIEFQIENGLSGIIGPNGCGKSNLVEALRWVMGETSAKQMRGNEMDDVIFSGTSHRPPRNLAEVILKLDNSGRHAPPIFNDHADLEISRRIERGAGSNYRVNGREVRARDVQLLFADATSGARSTALVSQGEIGALISAKPAERRHLLEEAGGITGLYSRRHEAELRLRAAEANLDRLEDVIATLQTQMHALKRQARQAARYRSISGRIRKAEAALLHRRWTEADAAMSAADDALEGAIAQAGDKTREAARAATHQGEAAALLPDLRSAEGEAAALLHRLEVARDALDVETERLAEATAESEAQERDILADLGREEALRGEAAATLRSLDDEASRLRLEDSAQHRAVDAAADAFASARAASEDAERVFGERTEKAAAAEAREAAIERRQHELQERLRNLIEQEREIDSEKGVIATRVKGMAGLAEADRAFEEARARSAAARQALEATHAATGKAEAARVEAEAAERRAREALRDVELARERYAAESDTLSSWLAEHKADGDQPIMDDLTIPPEFALALAAALGDDLLASKNPSAAAYWRVLANETGQATLPAGAEPLSRFVDAPAVLRQRLDQVGLVAHTDGARLQAQLVQGQRLVSCDGDLLRWDGFTAGAEALRDTASRVRQRQRLEDLGEKIAGLDKRVETLRRDAATEAEKFAAADRAYREARAREDAARARAGESERTLERAQETRASAAAAVAEDRSRLAALAHAAARLESERQKTEHALAEAAKAVDALPPASASREPFAELRRELAQLREARDRRFQALEALKHAAETRRQRLAAIDKDAQAWRRRAEEAERQVAALVQRRDAIGERLDALRTKPSSLRARRASLLGELDVAAARRREAASSLATAESKLARGDAALKAANEALALAREEKVRTEGRREQARSLLDMVVERIREKFACAPVEILSLAEITDAQAADDMDKLERQVERLHRERENMGAVNLRAEAEAAEIGEQIDAMQGERDDLRSAIAKLRSGIASLNREGRERLMAAFGTVNGHFRTLFERLFGGGRAHLELVGHDDPLEAGLEVMASPPGKRLQSLSLLSGGEKALAALALLFAVFLTNPAPICVLDEVDAPLDDHNVDRFCTMLEEIAGGSETRFLVITHHRLTMARMDRLFGVTMSERGVSQLVSVDMEGAARLEAAE